VVLEAIVTLYGINEASTNSPHVPHVPHFQCFFTAIYHTSIYLLSDEFVLHSLHFHPIFG